MDLLEARALHDEVPVIDLHADTPKLMHRLGFAQCLPTPHVEAKALRELICFSKKLVGACWVALCDSPNVHRDRLGLVFDERVARMRVDP